MSKILKIYLCGLVFLSTSAFADIAVIVHKSNVSKMDAGDIAQLYLDKRQTFANGVEASPLDLPEGEVIRGQFAKKVLKKSPNQLKSYWSKLLFTGKGKPPEVMDNAKAVLKKVSSNDTAIGYIDAALVDDSVRVVLTVK